MGQKLITGPTIEPITLAEAKAQLSISDSVQDDVITRHIVAARIYAENYTGSAFITQTWELALDTFPAEVELPTKPVQSITSVKYMDLTPAEQTLDAAAYGLDNYSPRHWLVPAAGVSWPDVYSGTNVVKVRYVAGFGNDAADVPAAIRQALLLAVGHWVNYQPQAELGVSVTMVPRAVDHLLWPYRRLNI